MKEWFTPNRMSMPNTLIPRRSEWIIKMQPALKKVKLTVLVKACGKSLSRRELIELRAGRSKPHRKNRELLVSVLTTLGLL
jgi:hypothetical protein